MFTFYSCTKECNEDHSNAMGKKFQLDPRGIRFNGITLRKKIHCPGFVKSDTAVYTEDFTTLTGTSSIYRTAHAMYFTFRAKNMPNLNPAGHAVTLWALLVSADSYPIPYALYRVNGYVAGNRGNIIFTGSIREGQTTDLFGGTPLTDAENDIVGLFAKSHGPANQAYMPAQLTTFDGGCIGDPDGAGPLPPCYEFLFAIHN